MADKTTVLDSEVSKFSAIADQWWDLEGKFKMLHKINPLRLRFITQNIFQILNCNTIKGLKILDIGCGGGLVSVPLAKMGAQVTGVDASQQNIDVANSYVSQNKIFGVEFLCHKIEDMKDDQTFDVILALEVIEHVNDIKLFLNEISQKLRPGGVLILSTINRTLKSLLTAKIGAEYILKWLPIGTHNWDMFVKPDEIKKTIPNFTLRSQTGMKFNIIKQKWYLAEDDLSVNYFLALQK